MQRRNLVIDVSDTKLVDHSVMEKLEEMERDFEQEGLSFEVRGLESLKPLADNAHAARKGGLTTVRRLTVVAEAGLEEWLLENFVELGATGYTSLPCSGAGRSTIRDDKLASRPMVRIEIVTPHVTSERILTFLRLKVLPKHAVTACVETVDVVRPGSLFRFSK